MNKKLSKLLLATMCSVVVLAPNVGTVNAMGVNSGQVYFEDNIEDQSAAISESFTVGGTTEAIKGAVRANADVTWSKNLTRSIKTTHHAKPGKIGYVAFKPYFSEVKGRAVYMIVGTSVEDNITARTPKKTAFGLCDGLEYLVYK